MHPWVSKTNKPRREAPRRKDMESKHTEAAPDRRAGVAGLWQIIMCQNDTKNTIRGDFTEALRSCDKLFFSKWNEKLNPRGARGSFAGLTKFWYSIYSYNLGKLAKRGGGGYPQALPKVINFHRILELPKILVLIRNPSPCSYNNKVLWKRKDSKSQSKKWVSRN